MIELAKKQMQDEAASRSYAAAADFENEGTRNDNETLFTECEYSKHGCVVALKSKRHMWVWKIFTPKNMKMGKKKYNIMR